MAFRDGAPVACDIEQLLQWAYCKHEVHRRLRDRQRGVGGSASSGAMDSVVKVQMNAIHGGPLSGGGGMPLGLPVGFAGDFGDIHPDALTIHNEVIKLDALSIGLVMRHAWECSRPDWGAPLEPLRPMRKGKGKVCMMRDHNQHAIASLLDEDTLKFNAAMLHLREVYTHWLGALLILRADLIPLLPSIAIDRPNVRVQPWNDLRNAA